MPLIDNFVATLQISSRTPSTGISSLPQRSSKAISTIPRPSTHQRRIAIQDTTQTTARSVTVSKPPMRGQDGFHPFNGHISRRMHERDQETDDMKPQDAYLSYYDVLLTKEDIDVLKDDWLTDNVISFYEEYLEREILIKHEDAHVILLRPSMTLMLHITPDALSLKEALPKLEGVSHIFLPINDNTDPSRAEGGSHWSLLVVSTNDRCAFHYDSMASSNEKEAKNVCKKMSQLLGYALKFEDLLDAPQQTNHSDCGVYVCMIMEQLLCNRLLQTQKGARVSMSMKGRRMNAFSGRKEIRKLIDDRRREGERRRSLSGSPHNKSGSKSPPRIE